MTKYSPIGTLAFVGNQLRARFDGFFENRSLSRISALPENLWNTILVAGLLFYLIRYKLHTYQYFSSFADVTNLNKLELFWGPEWDTLILSTIFFSAYVLLTKDSRSWRTQAEKCFSIQAMPRRQWKAVRRRWVIVWVVISNIPIFLGLAWFTDNIVVFSALFSVHHANAVLWLFAFGQNVNYFFSEPKFQPPDTDVLREFILERRDIMRVFLCRSHNIQRESLTALGYGISFVLAAVYLAWNEGSYVVPFMIVVLAEGINQYFYYEEKKQRDRGLREIDVREESFLENERSDLPR